MSKAIHAWHDEHAHFSSLLDILQSEIRDFHFGKRPNFGLMLDIVYYLRHFPDRFHHAREDVAFARILDKDPSLEPVIARLQQEHRVIANAGDELLKLLNKAVEEVVTPRSTLEMAAATYLVYYGMHIAKEEEDILPIADRLLTDEDWAAVRAAVPAGPDPLFGRDCEPRYAALRRQIDLAIGES